MDLVHLCCSTANRDGVLIYRFVGYVALLLDDHSVNV